jgi:hypothetical protein
MKNFLYFLMLFLTPYLGISQDIRIFNLNPIDGDSINKGGFIPLTDENIWTKESIEMANETTFGYTSSDRKDYELTSNERAEFLKAIRVTESENIYIYNILLDSILTYKVNKTPLVSRPSLYSGTEVGFKITTIDLSLMGSYYWNSFVYIGKSNPFQLGNIHPIKWTEVDSTLFPTNIKSTNHNEWYDSYLRGKVFKFKTDDYTYLIQNMNSTGERPEGRHLIVFKDNIETLVYNYIYMDTESTGLSPLVTQNENYQWTGKIFRDKPPIVYGFLWISFGCPRIDFIGGKEPSIGILCDNRH